MAMTPAMAREFLRPIKGRTRIPIQIGMKNHIVRPYFMLKKIVFLNPELLNSLLL
jgi:hypothetical protein